MSDLWMNYGIVVRLPEDKIKELRKYLEENYNLVFDLPSYGKLKIIREGYIPSGSKDESG